MSSINQNVRFAANAGANNPLGIYDAYKPVRFVYEARAPTPTDGENEWVFIDTATGNMHIKENGVWVLKYNIGGGSTPGGVMSASNVGGFEEVFKQLTGTNLEFRTLSSSDGSLFITQNADNIDLQVPAPIGFLASASSVGIGVPVYKNQVADDIRFRSITGDSNIGVAIVGDDVAITLTNPPTITTASSVGSGTAVYSGIVGTDLRIKSLKSTTGKITFASTSTEVDLGVGLTKADVGLNFVDNIRIGYETFSPPSSADAAAGFVVGSLWSQVGAEQILYVCTDATVGAAVWSVVYDSATPFPIVYPKDYASQNVAPFTLSISSVGPTLIAPPAGFVALNARGSWSINQNNGFGAVGLRRNTATDGANNNSFMITINASMYAPSLTTAQRNFSIVAYVNSLASAITGSGGNNTVLQSNPADPSGLIYTNYSHQFIYKASTAAAITFYFAIIYPNHGTQGTFALNFEELTIAVVQI